MFEYLPYSHHLHDVFASGRGTDVIETHELRSIPLDSVANSRFIANQVFHLAEY